MADIGKTVKSLWTQSVKAVNKAANNLAASTRMKVDEMSSVNRRRDLITEMGEKLYQQWCAGDPAPECFAAQLEEIRAIDERLEEMRAEREAKATAAAAATEEAAQEAQAEAPKAPAMDVPEEPHAPCYDGIKPELDEVPSIQVPETNADEKE